MKWALLSFIMGFLLISNTSSFSISPVAGTWTGVDQYDNHTDVYTFLITENDKGSFTGYIETKMDGALLPRMTITTIAYNHPSFRDQKSGMV